MTLNSKREGGALEKRESFLGEHRGNGADASESMFIDGDGIGAAESRESFHRSSMGKLTEELMEQKKRD